MRHTTAVLAAAALLTLTACSSSSSDEAPADTPPAKSAPKQQPADGSRAALEQAVRAYSAAYFRPDAKTAYAMLSARCQAQQPIEVYEPLVEAGAKDYGRQEIKSLTVDQVSGDMARVTYTYSVPLLDQKSQPWVREDGAWRYDAC